MYNNVGKFRRQSLIHKTEGAAWYLVNSRYSISPMPQEVSRKDFLKLMVAGASVVALGKFADLANMFSGKPLSSNDASRYASNSSEFIPFASAQSAGSWTDGPPVFVIAIHTALLPTGKV